MLSKAAAVHVCVSCPQGAAAKILLAILGNCIASCLLFAF